MKYILCFFAVFYLMACIVMKDQLLAIPIVTQLIELFKQSPIICAFGLLLLVVAIFAKRNHPPREDE